MERNSKKILRRTYLNLVTLTMLEGWSVQGLLDKKVTYNKNFILARIGEFLKRSRSTVDVNDDTYYQRVRIKLRNGGVEERNIEKGINIGTKKQFVASAGQFVLSKIDARNGAFGLIPKNLDGAIVTNDFPLFDVDKSKILPEFLVLITTTDEFISFAQSCSSGTTNRQRMDIDLFLNQKIPLPSIEEQECIVSAYNEKIERAKELEREAEELEEGIEKRLFNILGIKKNLIQNRNSKINITSFNFLSAWGVERLLRGGNKSILHSHLFENSKLSDKVLINPRTDLSHLGTDEKMSFIPMECISDEYGEVIELREGKKSLSGDYTKFKEGDLIWARITPCMQNGKSAIVNGLRNGVGYGSTEFHVIRSKDDNVLLDYIYHILRLKTILNDATNYFTGTAGQQRVPKSYLENLSIPIPPIEVQRKISDELYSVKSQIKDLNKQAFDLRDKAQKEFENKIFNN